MTEPSKAILKLISESARRLSTDAVLRTLSGSAGFKHRELRKAIRQLVESGELAYSYELGHSFLAPSFNRPVQVTERIVLTPPGHRVRPAAPVIAVTLAPGAAFGYGQHATTRMALQALDIALASDAGLTDDAQAGILDIGTGSGVLAIAAVMLGAPCAVGIDIEACARAEARKNVSLNNLGTRIRIDNAPLETVTGRFSIITANLRRPTLEKYSARIAGLLTPRGRLVLSGLKAEEKDAVAETYAGLGFDALQAWQEKGWAALLLQN